MNRYQAETIIAREGLGRCNFGDREARANEVGIQYGNRFYIVYSTDETARMTIIATFDSQDAAIEKMVDCLRVNRMNGMMF